MNRRAGNWPVRRRRKRFLDCEPTHLHQQRTTEKPKEISSKLGGSRQVETERVEQEEQRVIGQSMGYGCRLADRIEQEERRVLGQSRG